MVQAAADGIFLRDILDRASGVLCVLKIPSLRKYFRRLHGDAVIVQTPEWRNRENIAVGEALAAAAQSITTILASSGCRDIVLAASDDAEIGEGLEQDGRVLTDMLCMEAALFVVARPPDQPPQAAHRRGDAPVTSSDGEGNGRAVNETPAPVQRRVIRPSASSWGAMSALAGGQARMAKAP